MTCLSDEDKARIDLSPLVGESAVAHVYARTREHWNVEAANSLGKLATDRGSAQKRDRFHIAMQRYEEEVETWVSCCSII